MSDAVLTRVCAKISVLGSKTGNIFLSNFDGVWGIEPRLH